MVRHGQQVVDLNPSDFFWSECYGISGSQQVGYGYRRFASGLNPSALLWSGTASSAVDLTQFLPAGFVGSQATGVDTGVRLLELHMTDQSARRSSGFRQTNRYRCARKEKNAKGVPFGNLFRLCTMFRIVGGG